MTYPTVQPYVAKMERFELFSTAQCYYLIASDKAGTAFRVLKFDRTLIEVPTKKAVSKKGSSVEKLYTTSPSFCWT